MTCWPGGRSWPPGRPTHPRSRWINAALGCTPEGGVSLSDLVEYLLADPLSRWLERSPEVAGVLGLFTPALGETPEAATRALLAFARAGDPQETLQALAGGLQQVVDEQLRTQVSSAIRRAYPQNPEAAALYEHGLIPALEMAASVALLQIAGSGELRLDRTELAEALSSRCCRWWAGPPCASLTPS